MKRTSCLARNFYRRPSVRALVPDNRLLLSVLAVGCESHAGVWRPAGLSEDTGLNPDSIEAGLAELESRGLIARDKKTGELFLRDFYRHNTYRGRARHEQWAADMRQTESPRLRAMVLDAIHDSPECGLPLDNVDNSAKNKEKQEPNNQEQEQEQEQEQSILHASRASARAEKTAATNGSLRAPPPVGADGKFKYPYMREGIKCWTQPDLQVVESLVSAHGADAVRDAVKKIAGSGGTPYPSLISKQLKGDNHVRNEQGQRHINRNEGGGFEADDNQVKSSIKYYSA